MEGALAGRGALRYIAYKTNEPAGSQMIPSCCLVSALLPVLSLLQPLCSFISFAVPSASPSAVMHSETQMSHFLSSFASDPFVLLSNYGKLTLNTHQMSCFSHFVCYLQTSSSLNILPGCASRGFIPPVVISHWSKSVRSSMSVKNGARGQKYWCLPPSHALYYGNLTASTANKMKSN